MKRLLNGQQRVRTFTWDSQSRLSGAVTPDGDRWTYAYDSSGRRLAKQRVLADGSTAAETCFVWDGTRLIEQVGPGGEATTWDYAPGGYQPLTQVDQGVGGTRFHSVVTDLSGAPAELVSADGDVSWQQRTTLWGVPLPGGAGAGAQCPLRFPGQYADEETGWHYNYQRHYDPQTGQYTSPDPLGLGPGPNDDAYVPNPYGWIDPLGLYRDTENGQYASDPNATPGERKYTRDNQYPSEYRESTHDHMVTNYTDEGRAIDGVPRDSAGNKIPRDQLTWRDGDDNVIWDPKGDNPKPFNRTVTYEHKSPVVDHWNSTGRFSDRGTRNDFYNHVDDMEPMSWSENSRVATANE